jgi:hypothetical protein
MFLLYIPAFKSLLSTITGAVGKQIQRLVSRQA